MTQPSELTGAALDWAVAKCESKDGDCEIHAGNVLYGRVTSGFIQYRPSTDWAQGGPIIEREGIALVPALWVPEWTARIMSGEVVIGFDNQSPLTAAMRCYVASKLGDEIEIPEELQ